MSLHVLQLHLALASKSFKKKKKVLIPAMTFTATAAAALYCGLEPVFVDINEYDLNINLFMEVKKKPIPRNVLL